MTEWILGIFGSIISRILSEIVLNRLKAFWRWVTQSPFTPSR